MKDLATVAAEWNLGEHMKDPVRWLTRQIATGRIRARKLGRQWVMTEADMAHALDVFANPAPRQAEPTTDVPRIGLSAASARRRMAVAR